MPIVSFPPTGRPNPTNPTSYSLNALVDEPPDNPLAIIRRLFVGHEGTLGFVSR